MGFLLKTWALKDGLDIEGAVRLIGPTRLDGEGFRSRGGKSELVVG